MTISPWTILYAVLTLGVLLVNGANVNVEGSTFVDVENMVSCYDEDAVAYVNDGDAITKYTYDNPDGEVVEILCKGVALDRNENICVFFRNEGKINVYHG